MHINLYYIQHKYKYKYKNTYVLTYEYRSEEKKQLLKL